MPLFKWVCNKCGYKQRQLLATRPDTSPVCPKDSEPLANDTGGSTSVMESLDNGIMVRKVERYRDIEEMRKSHGELTKPKDESIV